MTRYNLLHVGRSPGRRRIILSAPKWFRLWVGLAFLAVSCSSAGCAKKERLYKSTRIIMDTIVEITVVHTREDKAQQAIKKAFQAMERVEKQMNPYDAQSEISIANQKAYGQAVRVSESLFHVIQESLKYSRLTAGAFDITVGPLMQIWPFYKDEVVLPTRAQIADALEGVGFHKLTLDAATRSLKFTVPHMALDLGGIAKGYAVDRATEVLQQEGIKNALVNAGGDLYALGAKPGDRKWRMGIRHPRKRNQLVCSFEVQDIGVATSGDYERYFEKDGRRYGHILDPKTGMPSRASISVTITAKDATRADALATGVFVLGPKRGLKLLKSLPGVEGLIISEGSEGRLKYTLTTGMLQLFEANQCRPD